MSTGASRKWWIWRSPSGPSSPWRLWPARPFPLLHGAAAERAAPSARTSYVWTDATRPEPGDGPASARQFALRLVSGQAIGGATTRTSQSSMHSAINSSGTSDWQFVQCAPASLRMEIAPGMEKCGPLFSPGANNSSLFYCSLLEELASRGFVVVGLEHSYEGRGQVLSDGRVVGPESERQRPRPDSPTFPADDARFYRRRVEVRARDAAFALDQLARLGETDSLLGGRLDLARAGVFGHSIGGVAAAEAARLDSRFRSVANLDGLTGAQPMYVDPTGRKVEQPFLFLGKPLRLKLPAVLQAKPDAIMRSVKGGSYRVLIAGAAHTSFSDSPFWEPGGSADKTRVLAIVRTFVTAFFEKHLLGQVTPLFDGPSPAYPEVSVEGFAQQPAGAAVIEPAPQEHAVQIL